MGGLSESAVILVLVAMVVGETLRRFPRNAESLRIKRLAFSLVPPYGGLLVALCHSLRSPLSFVVRCPSQSEAVVHLEKRLT